jgi:hypothetical protein
LAPPRFIGEPQLLQQCRGYCQGLRGTLMLLISTAGVSLSVGVGGCLALWLAGARSTAMIRIREKE